MASIDWQAVSKELTNELRNSDALTIAERGVTTTTSNQTGDGATTSFLVNRNNVKNVRSVTVGGVAQTYGTAWDFDLDYDDSGTIKLRVTFTSAPANLAAIIITYDYGPDKIWEGFTADEYKENDMPRIHWNYLGGTSDLVDTYGTSYRTKQPVSIKVLALDNDTINRVLTDVRDYLIGRNKSLYNVKYIRQAGMGPTIKRAERNEILLQRNTDILLEFDLED